MNELIGKNPIRILIVERSSYIQEKMKKIMSVVPDMNIIGINSSGKQAVQMVIDLEPDVVLIDIELEDMSGIIATKNILEKSTNVGIVLVTEESPSDQQVNAMIEAGARDCVMNHPSLDDLATAIHHTSLIEKR